MKKIVSFSFAILAFLFLSAFDFSGYSTPPKSRTSGGITIYYYDLRTPENRSGLIPASGPHYLDAPSKWVSLANNAKAYKDTVWNQVAAWENQSRPADSIIIKQRNLNWTGNLQNSIDAAINSIKNQYPKYDIKEVMVYPVHYPRTYPVSAADALKLMAEDEYHKSSNLDLEIDMGFSTVPKVQQPFGGGTRSTVWDTRALYFPTPKFKASDGKEYSFDNIQEVFTPINGKTPWLDGPGFWSNWVVAGYSQGKGLKYLVENGIWYGRAHPVLYTPGNDPYMRTMIYPDWSYIQPELINGYLYFDWAAMVSDNDYKIEAILYKKNSTPTPPPPSGGSCDAPDIIGGDLRYQYELDLEVTRIEGETVEKNSLTTTPVTVHRNDYSANREKVRNEIKADKAKAEAEKAQLENDLSKLEAEKTQLESQLAKAQSDKAICEAQPPDKNGNPPDCSSYDSQISSLQAQINAKQTEIDNKNCEIATKDAEIAGFQKELDDLQELEDQWRVVNTNVLLTFNGTNVGVQPVSLTEGETKVLNFSWTLPQDGTVKAEINPYKDLGIDEVTYSNNALDTPIYVATHATAACGPPGGTSSISGIVRTINDNGSTSTLREYLTGQIVNQSRNSMRAGYGFSFEVKTTYRNEDPKSNAYGPSRTESYFPTLVNYLPYSKVADGYQVNMDLLSNSASSPPRNETKTWGLPVVYVEEYSGNVFDKNYASHPKHNPNENVLNGGRKWYVDFEQPDGMYDFKAKAFDAGVNKLNVCMNGSVEIKGSFIGDKNGNDDFVRRSVNPNNPFPSGVGWNWIGKESIITALKDWWDGPPTDPDNAPSGYYYKTFMVDVDLLRRIKEYNDKYGAEVKLNDQFRTEIGGF